MSAITIPLFLLFLILPRLLVRCEQVCPCEMWPAASRLDSDLSLETIIILPNRL